MYLVGIGWMYVVLMMALAEALSSQGTVLGGIITFVLYGLLPMGLLLYILGTPFRRRALRAQEGEATAPEPTPEPAGGTPDSDSPGSNSPDSHSPDSHSPDRSGMAARGGVTAERKEP